MLCRAAAEVFVPLPAPRCVCLHGCFFCVTNVTDVFSRDSRKVVSLLRRLQEPREVLQRIRVHTVAEVCDNIIF